MNKMKSMFKSLLIILLVVSLAWIMMSNYSVIFAKSVVGQVTAVERIELPVALVAQQAGGGQSDLPGKAVSFSVAIRDQKTGTIFTAVSDDRQWAVVRQGQCADAEFLPYPPWELTRRGTFFGARLLKLSECQ